MDVKANTIPELLDGHFQIIEINGTKAEPLELYIPEISEQEKWSVLRNHWHMMYIISQQQYELGFRPTSFFQSMKALFRYNKSLEANKLK